MPNNPVPEVKAPSIFFYVILGASLFAFIQTFALLSPILLSFLLILLISLAVNPVITWMRALTGGRKRATGLLVAALVLVIALTGWAFFGPMKASIINLSVELPGYWERLQKPLIKMEQQAVLFEKRLQAEVTTEVAKTEAAAGRPVVAPQTSESALPEDTKDPGSIRSRLSEMFKGVVGSFTAVAFNAAQMLVVLVTVFFGVCFTLMNPRPILGAMFSLIPERHHGRALVIMQRISNFAPNWAGTTLLGMVTIGLLVFLIMWPIFGFKDAVLLGLIAAIMEAVPYLGPTLSAVPALLFALGVGGMTPLWVLIAYIAVQALENNVILPFFMARGMKLHPVAVIFSMLLSVAAFGVLGVLVAAPLVAIADILHDELYRKRFLPTVTDEDLDGLARRSLREKQSVGK
ncbi:MAG: AI-2E family transporter [Desulfobulbaceae bacterium]|nr:AI-2E family transporter [Desulfobulbaceae bacterium]